MVNIRWVDGVRYIRRRGGIRPTSIMRPSGRVLLIVN